MSRGAPRAPLTYEGEYDATRTYLPLRVVHVTAGATRTGYLSTATTTGDDPATSPTIWLPLGGGGDGEHNGSETNSTQVGTSAVANGPDATALGDNTVAGDSDVVIGSGAHTGGGTDFYGSVVLGAFASSADTKAVVVGMQAAATGYASVAIGENAHSYEDYAVALGSFAKGLGINGIAIGVGATAQATSGAVSGDDAIAIGTLADARGERSWAIGAGATVNQNHKGVLRANEVEIVPDRYAPTATSVILADGSGGRWRIGASTGGALTIVAA